MALHSAVSLPTLLRFTLLLLCLVSTVSAQTNKLFQWKFQQSLSTSLPTCQELPITVQSFNADNSTHGQPPYFMNAFAPGKTVESQFIGTDEGNLKWTVNFPAGTRLLLNVVDGNQSSGGVPPQVFTVVTGQSEQCIKNELSSPPSDFTMSVNVSETDTLNTCEPWGITVKGGVKPYKITLVENNSPVTTNVTMGPADDAFTFINRADPDRQLFAAISDLTGRWASGTAVVNTKGSTNVDCTGLVSSSGDSNLLKKQAADRAAAAAAAKKKRDGIIAGVTVPILLLLIGGGVFAFFWFKRRKAVAKTAARGLPFSDSDMPPKQLEGGGFGGEGTMQSGGQILSITSYLNNGHNPTTSTGTSIRSPPYPGAAHILDHPYPNSTTSPTGTTASGGYPYRSSSLRDSQSSGYSRPGFTRFPARSVRGSAKAAEAGYALPLDTSGDYEGGPSSGSGPALSSSDIGRGGAGWPGDPPGLRMANPDSSASPTRSRSARAAFPAPDEVVYQHTDAGVNVRELPPPYADSRRREEEEDGHDGNDDGGMR